VCYCFLSSLFLRLKLALITSYVSSWTHGCTVNTTC
jgi:hypothetical protein